MKVSDSEGSVTVCLAALLGWPMLLIALSEIQPASSSRLGRVSWLLGGRELCFQIVSLGAEAKAVLLPLRTSPLGACKGNPGEWRDGKTRPSSQELRGAVGVGDRT